MFAKLFHAIMLRHNFRKTYNELNKLSTRELEDIGINRSMITRVAMDQAKKITS